MKNPSQIKHTITSIRTSTCRSPLPTGFLASALALALAWFALSPMARAVTPAPDGGYSIVTPLRVIDRYLASRLAPTTLPSVLMRCLATATGSFKTAKGVNALNFNTSGFYNTAVGFDALLSNTTGSENTANGTLALASNTTGCDNTANGFQALSYNTTGSLNTANGGFALRRNTTGGANTASGDGALLSTSPGSATRPMVLVRCKAPQRAPTTSPGR